MLILEASTFVRENQALFEDYEQKHSYSLRFREDLNLPETGLRRLQKNATFNCIKIYNAIPLEIRQLPPSILRKRLKKFLLSTPVYSVEEFMDLDLSGL